MTQQFLFCAGGHTLRINSLLPTYTFMYILPLFTKSKQEKETLESTNGWMHEETHHVCILHVHTYTHNTMLFKLEWRMCHLPKHGRHWVYSAECNESHGERDILPVPTDMEDFKQQLKEDRYMETENQSMIPRPVIGKE